MADRMAILSRGVIEQLGTPEEVYRDPRTSYVAGFIGETNLCEGLIEKDAAGHAVRVGSVRLAARITNPDWQPNDGLAVKVSMRPEALRIDPAGHIAAKVVEKVYLGQSIQYWVETAFGRLQLVEQNPHRIYGTGDEVKLAIDATDVILLEK